jgi:DNA-binding MarR family transcriptional regulator
MDDTVKMEADRFPERLVSVSVIHLALLIRRIANLSYDRELEISQGAWRLVALVGENDAGISFQSLLEASAMDKGQLSRTISELEQQGYLVRDRSEGRMMIRLTKRGDDLYARWREHAAERNRDLVSGISEDELRSFFSTLDKLIEQARINFESESSR